MYFFIDTKFNYLKTEIEKKKKKKRKKEKKTDITKIGKNIKK
jgi:hypothetical protein